SEASGVFRAVRMLECQCNTEQLLMAVSGGVIRGPVQGAGQFADYQCNDGVPLQWFCLPGRATGGSNGQHVCWLL
ncbi:MAG: hypothetical protein ACK6EB_32670, partial [Planctomyces sp.]